MKVTSRRWSFLGPVAVLVLLASGCILWGTNQLGISAGNGVYAYLYQRPTDQVQGLYNLIGSDEETLLFMREQVVFSNDVVGRIELYGYYASDFDYFFDPSQVGDFRESRLQVKNTDKCLLLHRNPGAIWGDRHNWTEASGTNPDCRVGLNW